MDYELGFEAEPFAGARTFNEFEAEDTEMVEEWQGETAQESPQRVRWIQESLNKILGLRLKVDGIMGPQTRSAIRSFQQKQGLVADGVVGPKTENAIRTSSGLAATDAIAPRQIWLIEKFKFASASLSSEQLAAIDDIVAFIRKSQDSPNPIRVIDLLGHTDPVGSDANNYRLGCLRAWAVTKRLKERLGWQLVSKLSFRVASMGEKLFVAGDDAASRRVEVTTYESVPDALPKLSVRCDLPGAKPPGGRPPGAKPPGLKPPGTKPPVKKVPPATGRLCVSPAYLDYVLTPAHRPDEILRILEIRNCGDGAVDWRANPSHRWIELERSTGLVLPGSSDRIQVAIDPRVRSNSGEIVFISPQARTAPTSVSVSVRSEEWVVPPPPPKLCAQGSIAAPLGLPGGGGGPADAFVTCQGENNIRFEIGNIGPLPAAMWIINTTTGEQKPVTLGMPGEKATVEFREGRARTGWHFQLHLEMGDRVTYKVFA